MPKSSGCRYCRNRPLRFTDVTFTIATSNAVLEHLGSQQNQIFFVSELCRIATRVFITVPNKYFPIEHHTGIPLLHYYHRTFQLGCATMGEKDWALERNLILMTRGKLRRLAADIDRNVTVGYTGLLAGPLSNRRRCRRASERWPRFRRKRLRVLGANQ